MKHFLVILAIVVGLSSGATRAEDGAASFDWVWRTVNENFYSATFNGVDWNAMQTKYRDRASRAGTR